MTDDHARPGATHTRMDFELAWNFAESVQGWLTRAQGLELYRAAREVPAGQLIVEIGSHHGRSTVVLAAARRPGGEVLAVDPFDDTRWGGGPDAYAHFVGTLGTAGLSDGVRCFRGLSEQAARSALSGKVGMIFVDGAHDRASVRGDIDGWKPHLSSDARMLFHDAYSSPGVTAALLERFLGSSAFSHRCAVGSLVRIDRRPMSRLQRAASAARMLLRLGYLARNLVVKIAVRRGWSVLHRALGQASAEYPY